MTDPLMKYLSITKAYCPRLSADGRLLVFLSDTAGLPQIYEMPLAGDMSRATWRNQLTHGNERVLNCWFSPIPGDVRLIFARDIGGDENLQLYLIDSAQPDIIRLTAGFEQARHVWGDWSADGKQILYAANRRDPGLFDLYVQPIGGTARILWQNDRPGLPGPISFSPDASRALFVHKISRFQHELYEIDIEEGHISQLNPAGESVRFTGVQFARDGQSVYLNTDLDSNFLYVARLNLETLDFETVVDADWDIEHMTLSPDGTRLAYTVNIGGDSDLRLMELASGKVRAAPLPADIPGVVAEGDTRLAFSPFSRHIAFSYSTPIRSADIHIWNLDSDQINCITRSSHGSVEKASFRLPCAIHCAGSDAHEIPAWFYQPEGESSAPALVYLCGVPHSQHRLSLDPLIQFFLSRGMAVLAPNVRGSSGYGTSYSRFDTAEKRTDAVVDVIKAACWLKGQPGIDPNRVAIFGDGYGGYIALAALSRDPDLWAAGAVIAGMSNLVSFLGNTSVYRRAYEEEEYGQLASDRAVLESTSPIHQVDKIAAPLLIVHGSNNPTIPLSESEQVVEKLKDKEIPLEYLAVDGEGTEMVRRVNRRKAYGAVAQFLETHLLVQSRASE